MHTYCDYVQVNSEHILFLIYTSGSTGKPKGLVHTTAGYLLGAAITTKYIFDCYEEDVYGCTADIGWMLAHTHLLYGPLLLGITTVMFESVPYYPQPDRYWRMIEEHKITQFFTSPTAIRALKKFGDKWIKSYELKSLKVIATAGESINPEAWNWYSKMVGKNRCPVIDTYWQTETGSTLICPLPSAIETKPGSATLPFFGIEPLIVDPVTGLEVNDFSNGVLIIKKPWPSMARTILGDHELYKKIYFSQYNGYYFTGDAAMKDKDGYYWIKGRVDDIINISGHRLSTTEIEFTLSQHPLVSEVAVVAIPDEITGQSIAAFIILKNDEMDYNVDSIEFVNHVKNKIGKFAILKKVVICKDLPKTRSGKMVRRVLRTILNQDAKATDLGDISTIVNPEVVNYIIKKCAIESVI